MFGKSSRRAFLKDTGLAVGGIAISHSLGVPSCQATPTGATDLLATTLLQQGQLDPPANVDDFNADQRQRWSDFISERLDREAAGTGDPEGSRGQFYNPLKKPTADDKQSQKISWTAFPNQIKSSSPSDQVRWRRADASRDVQDEYCEWSVTRNQSGKITRVTFTCEGPEYWEFLAATDQAKTLAIYRQFVNLAIQMSDLYPDGTNYNSRNRFNSSTTEGAMHLVMGANTLKAEINIVALATITRNIDGHLLTGEQELITCGGYGVATRNSDPHIGGEVNKLARMKADITIANPIALYFEDLFPTSDWHTPDDTDPKAFWRIVRGTPQLGLRAVYEVPQDKGFVVGDIKIKGKNIDFGGQIADFIKIQVIGLACRFGQSSVPPKTSCPTSNRGFTPFADAVSEKVRNLPLFRDRRN